MSDRPGRGYAKALARGHALRRAGRFAPAARAYAEAEALARRAGDPEGAVDAALGGALAARALGDPRPALAAAGRSLAAYRARRDAEGIAFALWARGTSRRFAGDVRGALADLRAAHRAYRRIGDAEGETYALCALGGASRMAGRLAESSRFYLAAHALARRRRDAFLAAYARCGLGNAARLRGRNAEAYRHFGAAEKAYRRIGERSALGYTLWSRAMLRVADGAPCGRGLRAWLRDHAASVRLLVRVGDRRGLVYANLATAALGCAVAPRHPRRGPRIVGPIAREAAAEARRLGLRLEALHARALPRLATGRPLPPRLRAAYRRLGAAPLRSPESIP